MTNGAAARPGLLQSLTNAVYLDYVLKIIGVGGFTWAFLSAWHSLGFGAKAGMLASVATWLVGSRFSKIYR